MRSVRLSVVEPLEFDEVTVLGQLIEVNTRLSTEATDAFDRAAHASRAKFYRGRLLQVEALQEYRAALATERSGH